VIVVGAPGTVYTVARPPKSDSVDVPTLLVAVTLATIVSPATSE